MHRAVGILGMRSQATITVLVAMLSVWPAAAHESGAQAARWAMAPDPPGRHDRGPAVQLQGDEPLAGYLIKRFLDGHPDLFWRLRGRQAYAQGEYARARRCFERAAGFADKPSQAMLGEMHWRGLGGARDRALAYAWMDLAAERYYEDFYALRERYWSQLDIHERDQALRRGQALLGRYGDEVAKPRLARVLVRERPEELAVGGFFGNLAIIPPSGAGPDSITLRSSEYFDDTYWEPEAYFAWQDTIWKTLLDSGRVEVGAPRPVEPPARD